MDTKTRKCASTSHIYILNCAYLHVNASAVISFSAEVIATGAFKTVSLATAAQQSTVEYFHPTPPPIPKDPKGNTATSFKADGNDVSRLPPPVI